MEFEEGLRVSHKAFGEGIVISVHSDYADVNFLKFGKKSILFRALTVISNLNAQRKTEVTTSKILKMLINEMEKKKLARLHILQCLDFVKTNGYSFIAITDLKECVDCSFDYVFLKHLQKKYGRIERGKILNKKYSYKLEENNNPEPTSVTNLNDFEAACIKENFDSSIKLFYAHCIIEYSKNLPVVSKINVFKINDISEMLLRHMLYQVSVGQFYNCDNYKNPPFYSMVCEYVEDNEITKEEKTKLINSIAEYLRNHIVFQFLLIEGTPSKSIYAIDQESNLILDEGFISLIKKNGEALDKRLVSRISYYLNKNNDNSDRVKSYTKTLSKSPEKNNFVLKFQYENELSLLKENLLEDMYLKSDFKTLMKKHGIPANETYLKMCLDRLNYSLRTKRIILKSIYPTLKAYYREKVCETEVYRYSNPLNLDEYDLIIKSLNKDLILIEVNSGVYLTRKNMEKNRINEWTINSFKQRVLSLFTNRRYISLNELTNVLRNDLIINYCNGIMNQLLQFLLSIDDIKIVVSDGLNCLLCHSKSKKIKVDFIKSIIAFRKSIELSEIQDYVREKYGVEYSISDLEKDIKQTDFYYSPEMEKIYLSKKFFIEEVYYDGN